MMRTLLGVGFLLLSVTLVALGQGARTADDIACDDCDSWQTPIAAPAATESLVRPQASRAPITNDAQASTAKSAPSDTALSIRVEDGEGAPVVGARLEVDSDGWKRVAWTDSTGRARLVEGSRPALLRLTGQVSAAGFQKRPFEVFASGDTVRIRASDAGVQRSALRLDRPEHTLDS